MAHFITVPINENGVIFDSDMNGVVAEAIADDPFGFEDVYLYSHGWSTNAYRAMDEYNRFSVDLSKRILQAANRGDACLVHPPADHLGIGIHWPSEITEDPTSNLNALQLFTFYTMEHRADAVGKNAVYSLLRLMLTARAASAKPLRFFILGHSFGCKVVCSALNDLQVDIANGTIPVPKNVSFRVVLLQAATDDDNLEAGDIYGSVQSLPALRMLLTTSGLDKALNVWYTDAGFAANLFHKGAARHALGAAGPTQTTIANFGGADNIPVTAGFAAGAVTALTSRLVVADLTPVHQDRLTAKAYDGGFSGSHSDINFEEVYQLVMGFLFA